MVFSSLTFLQGFLPLCLLTYFISPRRCKNLVLLIFSLIFYAWGEPIYVSLMIFSTLLDYTCGRLVERARSRGISPKPPLFTSLIVNIGLLGVFKYSDFLIGCASSLLGTDIPLPNLPLPIGISFYTFQTMSYTIDVYRGEISAQKDFLKFASYVTLFPQLIAGPIVRYQTVAEELENRSVTPDDFAYGIKRFVSGLAKKVLLANNIGLLWEAASAQGDPTVLTAWLGAIAYGFQIYFDFSGYSDMAIGLGRMFGFHFLENFNYPFTAKSITDFWRRWHISMGTWFRDYVYIPLGGNRGGLAKQLRNIAIVWALTGFWHGASFNFVLWGIYFGLLLIIEKLFLLRHLKKLSGAMQHIYALFFISFSWPIFGFEKISAGANWILAMLGGGELCDSDSLYLLVAYAPMLILCAFAATELGSKAYKSFNEGLAKMRDDAESEAAGKRSKAAGKRAFCLGIFADCGGMLCLLLLSMAYLISGSYNPFLYFRF